jgi:hypothetical protein
LRFEFRLHDGERIRRRVKRVKTPYFAHAERLGKRARGRENRIGEIGRGSVQIANVRLFDKLGETRRFRVKRAEIFGADVGSVERARQNFLQSLERKSVADAFDDDALFVE